jgi:DNA polymerase-4
VRDREALGTIFTRLCEQLDEDLQRKGYVVKTIGIKLRYDNFQSVTRDQTLTGHVNQAQAIRHAAGQCLKRVDLSRRLRLLGVRVGSLIKLEDWQAQGLKAEETPMQPYTESLFEDDLHQK